LDCFGKQHRYNIDRLIAAANMFDILPSTAVPIEAPLSKEVKEARQQCRQIFKALNDMDPLERESLFDALSRVGRSSLKRKIHHRAKPIIEVVGDRFPELISVVNLAVDCRNHYVHGGHGKKPKLDYDANPNAVNFFYKHP
jgi:ApeA N-terminal domain 1